MSFAYSNTPIFTSVIGAGSSPAQLVSNIHAFLTIAGWSSTAITNGYSFTITSPQMLTATLNVRNDMDSDYPNCIAFQMVSTSDPTKVGYIHHIQIHDTGDPFMLFSTYQVWANGCQFFIGQPGHGQNGFLPRSFSCGIPYAYGAVAITGSCNAVVPGPAATTTEMWWSCGDDGGVPIGGTDITVCDFRNDFFCNRASFMYNGTLVSQTRPNPVSALQLVIFRPSTSVFLGSGWVIAQGAGFGLVEQDGTPRVYDPLLAAPFSKGAPVIICAELYDAAMMSMSSALEETVVINDTVSSSVSFWTNYSTNIPATFEGHPFGGDDGRLCSLLLLQGTPVAIGGLGNYVY